jgi:hypothetical protein
VTSSELRARRKQHAENHPEDPRHGTLNFYNNYFCRCPPCSEANNQKRKKGSGPTRRVNTVRVVKMADVLMHHRMSEIHGECRCGYPAGSPSGMEHHRARMVSDALFGTKYKDCPDRQNRPHLGSAGNVVLHLQKHEALCIPCLEFLDSDEK